MNTLWGQLWALSAVIGGFIVYQLSLWGLNALANAGNFNLLTLGHSIAHKLFVASHSDAVSPGYGSACFEWTLFSPGPTIMASCLSYSQVKTERVCVMVSFNHNNYSLLSALSTLLYYCLRPLLPTPSSYGTIVIPSGCRSGGVWVCLGTVCVAVCTLQRSSVSEELH